MAVVGPDGSVLLGEVGRARPDAELDARVGLVALSADGGRIAGAFDGGEARVWDARIGAAVARLLDGDRQPTEMLALSADGALLLVAKGDAVRLWDVAQRQERCCWRGHGFRASSLAFSPSGRHALTCAWGGRVRLWEVATGEEALRLEDVELAQEAAFDPGAALVAGWGLTPAGLAVWETRAGRLTPLSGRPGQPVGGGVAMLYDRDRDRCSLLDLRTGRPLPAAPDLRLWVRPPQPRSIED